MRFYIKSLVLALALSAVVPASVFAKTTDSTFVGFVQSIGSNSLVLQSKNRYQQTVAIDNNTMITMQKLFAGSAHQWK